MSKNACIIYMSCKEHVISLGVSLLMLYINFNNRYNYPVYIYHSNITLSDQKLILNKIKSAIQREPKIFFIYYSSKQPAHILTNTLLYNPPLSAFNLNYRSMCRFFSGRVYTHPVLKDYEWYWRLDSDSFILSPITYDVFEYMESNNYLYGHCEGEIKESEGVVVDLWETTKKFIKINNLSCPFLDQKCKQGVWQHDQYYTNFEIAKFSFFRGKQYMSYFNTLDMTGKFFYNRWGDGPVHWLGVHMFLTEKDIFSFKDISYSHGFYYFRNISNKKIS